MMHTDADEAGVEDGTSDGDGDELGADDVDLAQMTETRLP